MSKPHPFGWGWRYRNHKTERYVTVSIKNESWSDVESFVAIVRGIAATLDEPNVDLSTESYEFGEGSYADLCVVGWRVATDEEIVVRQAELDASQRQRRQHEEHMLEQLRSSRPELFRE